MQVFRGFAVSSAVLAFFIAVLGSWVRINDAGLTCPDWPLCHGQLIPPLGGGVVLEWSHRLVAFVEGIVVLGTIASGIRMRRRITGVTTALVALGTIFAVQVSLGGATVLLGNSPPSVMLHWAMGMALLADLTILAVLSLAAPAPATGPSRERSRILGSAAAAPAVAAAFAFATMCLGAYVSSSYAGLACAGFPACDAASFGPAQALQMAHRLAAGAFALTAAYAAASAWQAGPSRARAFTAGGFVLVLVQVVLGAANVYGHLPIALREAHAANAAATFVAFVVAATLAALGPRAALVRHGRRLGGTPRIATHA